jgi:hypothetical protein
MRRVPVYKEIVRSRCRPVGSTFWKVTDLRILGIETSKRCKIISLYPRSSHKLLYEVPEWEKVKEKTNGCGINTQESFCFVSPSIPRAFS